MPRASSSYRSPPVAPKANVRAPKRPTTVSVVTVTIRGRGEVSFLDWRAVPGFQGVEADPHGLAVPGGSSFLVAHTDENGKIEYDDLAHPERALDQTNEIGLLTGRRSSTTTATTRDQPSDPPAGSTTSHKRTATGPPPLAAERKRTRSQSVVNEELSPVGSNRGGRGGGGRGRGRGRGPGKGKGRGRSSLTPISDTPIEASQTTPLDEKPPQPELGSRLRSSKFKDSSVPVPSAPTLAPSGEQGHEDETKPSADALGEPSTFSISSPPKSPPPSRPSAVSARTAVGPRPPRASGIAAIAMYETDSDSGSSTLSSAPSTRSATPTSDPVNEPAVNGASLSALPLEMESVRVGSSSNERALRDTDEQIGPRVDRPSSSAALFEPRSVREADGGVASSGHSPVYRSMEAALQLPDGPENIDKASRIEFVYDVSMAADMDLTSSEDEDVFEPPASGEVGVANATADGLDVEPPVEGAATEVTARSPSVPSSEAPIDFGGKTPKPNEPAANSDGTLVAGDSPLSARVASPRQATPAHTPPPTVDQQLRSALLQTSGSFAHLALESPALATGPEEHSAPSRPETPTPPLGGTERDRVANGEKDGSPTLELTHGSPHQPDAVETDREPKVVDEVAHRPVESAGFLQAGPPRSSLAPLAPSSSAPELARICSDRPVALDRTSSYPSNPFARPAGPTSSRPNGFISPPSTEQHHLAVKVGAHASGVRPAVMEVASKTPTPEVNPRQVRAAVAPSPPKEHVGETAFSGQAKTPPMLSVEYASSPPSTPARPDSHPSNSGLLAGRARLGELDVGTPRDEDLSPLNRSARDALRAAEVTPSPGAALYSAGPSRLSIGGLPQRWATQEPSAPDMGPLLPALRITTSLPGVRPSLDEIAGREGRERLPSSAPPSSPPLDADASLFTPPSDRSPEPDFDARRTRPGSEINDHPTGSSLKSDLAAGPLPRPGGRNQQSRPHVESSDDEPVVTRPPGSGKARSRKNRPLHPPPPDAADFAVGDQSTSAAAGPRRPPTYKKTKRSGQSSNGPSSERLSTVRVDAKSRRVLSASEDETDDFGTSSHLAPSTVRTSSSQALATVGSSRTSGNQLSERTPVDDEPKSLRIKLKRPDQQTLDTAKTETRKQKKRVKRDRRVIEKLAIKKDGPRDGEEDISKHPRPEPATSTDVQVYESLTRTTKRESANRSEREGTQKEAGPASPAEGTKHDEVIVLDDKSKSPLPVVSSKPPRPRTDLNVERASAPSSPKPQHKPKPSLPRKSFNLADLAKGPSKPRTSSKPPDKEQTTAIDKKQEDEITALKKAYFAEVDKDYDKPLDIDAQGDVMREFETFQEAHLNLRIKPPFRVTPYSFPHGPTGWQIAEQFKKETQQQQHQRAQQHTTQSPATALVNAGRSDIDAPLPYPKNATEATDFNVRWVEEMEGKWGDREAVEAYMRKHGWGDLNLTLRKGLGWGFWG